MRASYRWLKELCRFEADPAEVADRLTLAGLEVEGQKRYGELPGVVVAEVRAKRPHPSRDKLTLVTVFDGKVESEVVCGAPNVPAPGKLVLLAQNGAKLPNGMVIAERNLGGVVSNGMLCGETELDIGSDDDGIVVLEQRFETGTLASRALNLEDTVFEIGLTPNRPDCLGHLGLARELSALLGAPLELPKLKTPKLLQGATPEGTRPVPLFRGAGEHGSTAVGLSVSDSARCPRYAGAVVEGVTIAQSPFWLRYRLHVLGLRAINNVVDITNLVLMEYGYPTHAFDLANLRGARIDVRSARAQEKIVTLDGIERALHTDDLLICDGEGPVAVAGVMGGEHSGVSARTERVFVETAYFDPRAVRRTSRRLGLHTDASHRFERGVDPRAVPEVLGRVVSLIGELAGGSTPANGFEVYAQPFAPKEITLRIAAIERLLGAKIELQKAQEILQALGCDVTPNGQSLKVLAPTWRPDLTREEDLIEEVARVIGYDNLPTETPHVMASTGASPLTRFLRQLKERAAAVGLTEAVNLAFTSQKQLEAARAPLPAVRVANPLSEERGFMRSCLLPGLATNLLRAQRHQVERVSLFELARTFRPSGEALPHERHKLSIVLWGTRGSWLGDDGKFDFYDGKGVLEALIQPLTRRSFDAVVDARELSEQYPALHPRRSALLSIDGRAIGALGELHPDVLDALELSGPVIFADLDVARLFAVSRGDQPPHVRANPRFPASARDIAIVVDEGSEAGQVAIVLREAGGALVENVELFDLYRGDKLPAGRKSLAFRVTYRDPDATLTDQRVDEAHAKVVAEARSRFQADLRG
ncbi:MAG TPA: phenylalanine--tRNA ligase subunit beta [Polyangiales bacterium]|nr:phenylalanine--tRNA ligase subunit beta [Polyangiales bacterium]